MGKVPAQYLLIIAGIIWCIAGANVAAIGIQAFMTFEPLRILGLAAAALVVFAVFFRMFRKMVAKHTKRIQGYNNEKTSVLKFFDARGYLIMAVMMTFGFGARALGVFPNWFLAFFYTGLGVALAGAGVLFARTFWRQRTSNKATATSIPSSPPSVSDKAS